MNHPGQTVYAAFAAQVQRTPGAVALVCGETEWTYAELDARAGRLARQLRETGVTPGTLVGIYLDRHPAFIVAMLAILRAGGAYLPLDTSDPDTRCRLIVADAAPTLILTESRRRDRVAPLARTLCVDAPGEEGEDGADGDHWVATTPGDLAYVMYTSGSTGRPKGVCTPHRAIVSLVVDADYVTLGAGAVLLQMASVSFDAATFEIWGTLLTGARLVVVPAAHPSLDEIAGIIRRHGVTTMFLTSAVFRQVVDEYPDLLAGVRQLITGGDVVSATHVRKILERLPALTVINAYGPTECTTFACGHPCTSATVIGERVPIGRAIAGRSVHLLHDDLRPAAAGAEGEICIGGDGVALGYLRRPDATLRAFVRDPFRSEPDARLYRTGDRGRWLPDGALEFVGRTDRQVKIRGYRVELGEVEAALRLHPAVRDVIATVEANAAGGQDLVAHVVADPDAAGAKDDAVTAWQQIYEDVIYRGLTPIGASDADPTLNTVGWNSSYTGAPIAREEMLEQVEATVARIRERQPRRILEVGCGTGMLLFRLAPDCTAYVATDFSRAAREFVERHLPRLVPQGRVRVLDGRADDLPADGRFDAVIFNSIVQHFPTIEYLRDVLQRAIALVDDDGFVFVGDVRSLPLLRLFHHSVELGRVSDALLLDDFRALLDRREHEERQLVVDPAFFESAAFARVCDVRVQLKRGRFHNELTRFRYDVVIEVGAARRDECEYDEVEAPHDGTVEAWLPALLQERAGRALRIRQVANRRTAAAVRAAALLEAESPPRSVGALRERLAATRPADGIDPEEIWRVAEAHGYQAQINWRRGAADGSYDVMLTVRGRRSPVPRDRQSASVGVPWQECANRPLRPFTEAFVAELRRHLRERLPSYMMPARIVCLDRWPLTSNGKIDVSQLFLRRQRTLAPESPLPLLPPHVRTLASLWRALLGVERVDLDENFFDLGGDSLKAIQLAHQASRTFGMPISPVSVFERPTLGALADLLGGSSGVFESDVAASRARGASRRTRAGG